MFWKFWPYAASCTNQYAKEKEENENEKELEKNTTTLAMHHGALLVTIWAIINWMIYFYKTNY